MRSCALRGFLQKARWIRRTLHKAFLTDPSQGELPFPLRCFAAIPLIPVFANPQAGQTLTGFANLQAVHCHPSFQSGNAISCGSGTLQAVSGSGSARLSRTALLGEFPNPEDRTLRGCAFFQNAKNPSGSFFCFCRMGFTSFY